MEGVGKCGATLACGHECHGYAGETEHISCLEEGCEYASKYHNGSDDCAICLGELNEEPCVELTCGHIWHLECLRMQLKVAQPNPAKRLLFTGCSCGQCGQFCDHPALRDTLRSVSALREKVDRQIMEQARVDSLQDATAVTDKNSAYYRKVLDYGRHLYAFYQCSICEEPYFGGTVACADAEDRELKPEERMCQKCNPVGSAVCANSEHRAYYVWKCRLCCSEATYVCYGSAHFCQNCHNRMGDRAAKTPPIPCPGAGKCRLRMDPDKATHSNGPGPENEMLLSCSWCESDPLGSSALSRYQRGSQNMLFNPNGAEGVRGWQQFGRTPWQVEQSDLPIFSARTNFVSSYAWCIMVQGVDLRKFLINPNDASIEVSARYMARTDCASVFFMRALLISRTGTVLQRFTSGQLRAPADCWDQAKGVLAPGREYQGGSLFGSTQQAAHVVVIIGGKDTRFWRGNFGSKATCCQVRMLYDDSVDDEQRVILPAAFETLNEETSRESLELYQRVARKELRPQRQR